jgi:phage-related baseplate assembly protein
MNLSELQPPQIIEELSFEEILLQMKEALVAIDQEYTAYLGSDPLMKLFEIAAYREVLLRQRINQAAKGKFASFRNRN